MANGIFVFDGHAHLSSQNVYPCIMPAAADTEALDTSKYVTCRLFSAEAEVG